MGRLYAEFAEWWPLLSPPEEYAEESSVYITRLRESVAHPLQTCLELGSGGGNNASFMKRAFAMTLVDLSPGMLAHSRALNPECEHHVGDMRTVRLGRTFDAVFVHDAVCYMTTRDDLAQVARTAFAHCAPGGAALFCPDFIAESFQPGVGHGGVDAPDGRGLRYMDWTWDPDPTDTQYLVDFAYLLRTADGQVRAAHDRHVEGLFPRATWLEVLSDAGFVPNMTPLVLSDGDAGSYEMFIGKK